MPVLLLPEVLVAVRVLLWRQGVYLLMGSSSSSSSSGMCQ
jgi:hypothetical protein